MMPSSIVRASENGRPFLPVGRGSIPSINDHWASDSNWNRDTIPDSQPDPELFIRHALSGLAFCSTCGGGGYGGIGGTGGVKIVFGTQTAANTAADGLGRGGRVAPTLPAASGSAFSKSSSTVLARNLLQAGFSRPAESAAHHIVAGNAYAAIPARDVLARFKIDINSAANGVFLPASRLSGNEAGAAVHSMLHTRIYYDSVNAALLGATTREEALQILAGIRGSLLQGGYP